RQVGVRCETDGALEKANELERREADMAGEILQAKFGGVFGAHAFGRPRQQHAVAGRRVNAAATAAMSLEELAERTDQQLALAKHIAPLLDGAMHRQKALYQIGIAEQV